jgi:sigma-B regulation protein RsbU (phosphoserine phosphatase)
MALGVLEDFPYESGDERMGPGDVLVIYSDGIPDAVNEFEHPFGEERLIACLRECAAEPAAEILRRVVTAVREHEQGAERIDDLTIVVVKRTS